MTTLIYIDDDPNNTTLITRILLKRRADLTVLTASNGHDGLILAHTTNPELILLDGRLPDMPGTDVLRELKTNPTTATIPVVMFSGDSGRTHTDEFEDLGAADFLPKPFEINQLLTLVNRFCPHP